MTATTQTNGNKSHSIITNIKACVNLMGKNEYICIDIFFSISGFKEAFCPKVYSFFLSNLFLMIS